MKNDAENENKTHESARSEQMARERNSVRKVDCGMFSAVVLLPPP